MTECFYATLSNFIKYIVVKGSNFLFLNKKKPTNLIIFLSSGTSDIEQELVPYW